MHLPIHIVLLSPEIPHNTGAIGRLCVGVDCALHLIRPLRFHLTDEAIRRAGLDYWSHLRLTVHDTWEQYLTQMEPQRLVFASTHGARSLYDHTFAAHDHIVFGSESRGLPSSFYEQYAAQMLRIPMPGAHARSINLANAVAISLYEAYRQLAN